MTTLQSNASIGPDMTITAKMSTSEWAKVLGVIIAAAVSCAMYVSSLQAGVEKAVEKAEQAVKQAESALVLSTAVKTDLQNALVALSAKLGRIEGLLERLTQETHK